MELTPMRFKEYTWPHNPRVYSISYEQHMTAVPVPGGYDYITQTGTGYRVMRGEGEFVGVRAYEEFRALATVFYDATPGLLVHPVWQNAKAYFAELKLEQEPRSDYVRYSFAFWESLYDHETTLQKLPESQATSSVAGAKVAEALYHTVVKGESLTKIARQYGLTLEQIIAKNPQIKNINLIYVGDRILVS